MGVVHGKTAADEERSVDEESTASHLELERRDGERKKEMMMMIVIHMIMMLMMGLMKVIDLDQRRDDEHGKRVGHSVW